jgi:hypothetical protein
VKAAKRGSAASTSAPGSCSVAELEDENAEVGLSLRASAWGRTCKKGPRILCSGAAARYEQLKTMRLGDPIALLCHVFDVSRCGFDAWLNRKPSSRQ